MNMFIVEIIRERYWYFAQDKNSRARPMPSDSFGDTREKARTKMITQYCQRKCLCGPQAKDLTVTSCWRNAIAGLGKNEGFSTEYSYIWLYCQNPAPGSNLSDGSRSMMLCQDGCGTEGRDSQTCHEITSSDAVPSMHLAA